MMEISLTVFTLALFIIKGLSLECEECLGIEDCSGNMVTCASGKDRCSITKMVLPVGLTLAIKSCVSSDVCDKGVQVINLGHQEKVVAHLKCCNGNECRMMVPPASPPAAQTNGKQCPACFSLEKDCHEEMIDCVGDEQYCAKGHLSSNTDMLRLASLKGCANKAVCDSLVVYNALAPKNNARHSIQCLSNSSVLEFDSIDDGTGSLNTIPRWFGLFLPILSGILLRKLLA